MNPTYQPPPRFRLSEDRAARRSERRLRMARRVLLGINNRNRTIRLFRLDNPYMSYPLWRFMLAQAIAEAKRKD